MSIDLNKIKDTSFLVTGGAGFIGSNLVEFLLSKSAKKVRVLDNFSNGHRKNIENFLTNASFELIEGDIRALDTCKKACEEIDYVLHQAALGSVPRSINDPIATNEVNVNGFLNMLVAIKDSKVKRMIYAASSSTYGDSVNLPKIENVIGNPLSPYAVTKYVNELYAQVFAKTYGVETIGLRYFNVYGPKQDPQGAYAAVIPLFIQAILDGESPYINGDGEQTRDFTYIDNVIQANVNAMFTEKEGAVNEVMNIAVGQRTSLNDMFQILTTIENKSIVARHRQNRTGDVKDSLADISKAKRLINYDPKVNFYDGLVKTYRWYQENQAFVKR